MNIFKKIEVASKLVNTINKLKRYFDNNYISIEIKTAINGLKNDLKKIAELIPVLEQSIVDILEILK